MWTRESAALVQFPAALHVHVYVIQVTQDLVVIICVVVAPAQGRVEGAPDLVVEDDDFDLVRGGVCDQPVGHQIGRASCRERGGSSVPAGVATGETEVHSI